MKHHFRRLGDYLRRRFTPLPPPPEQIASELVRVTLRGLQRDSDFPADTERAVVAEAVKVWPLGKEAVFHAIKEGIRSRRQPRGQAAL